MAVSSRLMNKLNSPPMMGGLMEHDLDALDDVEEEEEIFVNINSNQPSPNPPAQVDEDKIRGDFERVLQSGHV